VGPVTAAVDAAVAAARRRYRRLDARQAAAERAQGALLVDTRPSELRRVHGHIPGALVVDRNVLEWRLDPTSAHRLPPVSHAGVRFILFCQEGFASSLAVGSLLDLGLTSATDLVGGFAAWRDAGLPVSRT